MLGPGVQQGVFCHPACCHLTIRFCCHVRLPSSCHYITICVDAAFSAVRLCVHGSAQAHIKRTAFSSSKRSGSGRAAATCQTHRFPGASQVIRQYHGHLSGIYALALHPTLDVLISGGRDSVARVWDMRTKVQVGLSCGNLPPQLTIALHEAHLQHCMKHIWARGTSSTLPGRRHYGLLTPDCRPVSGLLSGIGNAVVPPGWSAPRTATLAASAVRCHADALAHCSVNATMYSCREHRCTA